VLVVATKADRLKQAALEQSVLKLRDGLALPDQQPLILSSKDGTGRNELWRAITSVCTAPPGTEPSVLLRSTLS